MQGACAGKLVAATHKQINKHFLLPPSHLNHSLPPVAASSRMFASTSGQPVVPFFQRRRASASVAQG